MKFSKFFFAECRPKQKTLDASSSPIAPDPEESNFMTAACLEELLKEEGIKSEEHVALSEIFILFPIK